ncbi:MAG TPA: pyridoxamine 5'-phosphate oxidase [Bacteroidales bacterium]|nr:pyridoxamine 5'-phosphate oxidase [Bacteroidales bacterium]
MKLDDIRTDYLKGALDREHMNIHPVSQFAYWMDQAVKAKVNEPTAMTLATADAYGKPSARIVLLKHFDHEGFVFYTNFSSRKGSQLEANTYGALLFFWPELERQVRIEGPVVHGSDKAAEEYFSKRPYESQISALTSPQSERVPNREYLEKRVKENKEKYPEGKVPKPDDWGGYRLKPEYFEFWQGRTNRLHDRFRYTLIDDDWRIERLAP